MKNWISKNYKTLIISAFLIPIIIVAIVSISHVTMWYGLSNPISWATYLSLGIEIAALSALAAISANMGSKVYFPFIIVTIIQFIGNIFFAYSFIDVTSKEFVGWVELVSPLLEFIGIESTDLIAHKRVLSLFSGGLLPVISLSFLHMLVKFTEETNTERDVIIEKKEEEVRPPMVEEVEVPQPMVEEVEVPQKVMEKPRPTPTQTTPPPPLPTIPVAIEDQITEEPELDEGPPPLKLSDEKLAAIAEILNRFNRMNVEEEIVEDEDTTYDEDGFKVDLDDEPIEEVVDPPVDDFKEVSETFEDESIVDQVEDENVSEDTEKKN